MLDMYRTLIFILSLTALGLLAVLGPLRGAATQGKTSFDGFKLVDESGNIRKPADYRDHYQALGTWAVLNPTGNELHVVYASPGAAEYYRKNGKFADGTVLVKEVFATDHAQMTTGDAYRAAAMIQWFVMIKDEKHRFPKSGLWGDGWGWALFKADAPDKQVANNFKTHCISCHVPAQSTDWVYIQGYPVLKSK